MIRLEAGELENLESYKLLTGIMVPRPIALVSTVSAAGVFNAAPFSWNTVACIDPPIIAFTCFRTPGRLDLKEDTLRNVEETGTFVSNVVTYELERRMVECSEAWPPEVDEFSEVGLTPAPSDLVAAPRVAEAPVSLECRVERLLEMGGGECVVVLGRVVRIHVADSVLVGGRLDLSGVGRTGRMAGTEYTRTDESFLLDGAASPQAALAASDYLFE